MKKFPCHSAHIVKLNRVEGQLSAIKKMITDRRYCVDILIQLKAVRGAVTRVQKDILKTHLEHCVSDAITSKDKSETNNKIREILKLMEET